METGPPELLEDLFAPPAAADLAVDPAADRVADPSPVPEEDR